MVISQSQPDALIQGAQHVLLALNRGDIDALEQLVSRGISFKNFESAYSLARAAVLANRKQMLPLLEKLGIDLAADGSELLVLAAEFENIMMLEALIEQKPQLKKQGKKALLRALGRKSNMAMDWLLAKNWPMDLEPKQQLDVMNYLIECYNWQSFEHLSAKLTLRTEDFPALLSPISALIDRWVASLEVNKRLACEKMLIRILDYLNKQPNAWVNLMTNLVILVITPQHTEAQVKQCIYTVLTQCNQGQVAEQIKAYQSNKVREFVKTPDVLGFYLDDFSLWHSQQQALIDCTQNVAKGQKAETPL